jgi:hypothetical protein
MNDFYGVGGLFYAIANTEFVMVNIEFKYYRRCELEYTA